MSPSQLFNAPAPGVPYFTPAQYPAAGTAVEPQPDDKPLPKLFQPIKIRGVEFQNRIWLSPLCQYSADNGAPTAWHMAHRESFRTRTRALVQFAHSQNQKIGIQLAHAGRKASTVAPGSPSPRLRPRSMGLARQRRRPSALQYAPGFPQPTALTTEGIRAVVVAFADAARRSLKAGFDVIEIHGAHGYLLGEFLSPAVNKRTDEYGGSFENRTRLLLEVVDAVRAIIPADMPLFVRISATDWLEKALPNEPSWRSEDTVRLAPILAEHGVDLLDVSSGGSHSAAVYPKDGPVTWQAPFAADVKKAAGDKILVSAVGACECDLVVVQEQADVTFVGRTFQKNPGLVWSFAEDLGVTLTVAHQIEWPFAGRGSGIGRKGVH
ncbi:hypothetical protein B0H21DRAFT_836822 [Amylocystis lapponica]|nr:hypothetical protein B0H21DRAFT_836822 [Amylocystis lapponica]